MMKPPFTPNAAKPEMLRRLKIGTIVSSHFRRACAGDGFLPAQAIALLPASFCSSMDWEDVSWRYRFVNGPHIVVVAFPSDSDLLELVSFFKK